MEDEPMNVADFAPATFSAAVEAIHVANTGRDRRGNFLPQQKNSIAGAVEVVHLWQAARDRLSLELQRASLEVSAAKVGL
jgi:hypothetical protein